MDILNRQQTIEIIERFEKKLYAFNHAMGILSYDGETVAPARSVEGRGVTIGIFSELEYELYTNPDLLSALAYLEEHASDEDPVLSVKLRVIKKQVSQLSRILKDEYIAYSILVNEAQQVWENAKNTSDFSLFAPFLEKLVDLNRKFAGYYNPDLKPYDALLNEYEEGMTTDILDPFFNNLRGKIVPLLKKINRCEVPDSDFLHVSYPVEMQKKLSASVMNILGIDRSCCGIGETEHPFTTGFNNKDLRITTHYYEYAPESSLYSVIHEGGHAIYELDCDDIYNYTVLSGGVSMGIHESQSRFYENIIGRSRSFVHLIYKEMVQLFPVQMQNVTEDMLFRAVNKVTPSLIRTESDELTYSLHVMIRYEIEKELISGALPVSQVPERWNSLYKEYLGVTVPDDRHGCLQDSHWSGGSFGYFPSYALGNAYGAQILFYMQKDFGESIDALIDKGRLEEIRGWLKERIHRYACLYKPSELFERSFGKFDPSYYSDYLYEKFSNIYGLKDAED